MAAVPATLMLILMLRLPESPRWLVKRNDHDGARMVLERIRPPGADVSGELQDIVEVEDLERKAGVNRGWHGLRQRWVRPALITGCGIAVFTQLSGIEMIIYYAPTILTKNHFSTSAALRVSVGLGVTYLVMMIVGLSIVDHVGRRRLTLTMIPGAAIALAVLGVLFIGGGASHKTIGLIIVCLILFMIFNAGGLQLMGWLTGSEIYPLAVRGAGTSAQSATLWTTNLVITLSLLSILGRIGAGPTMWLYAGFNVAAWLFIWRRMPELTGRSLEQIEGQLHSGHFRPRDFKRPESRTGGDKHRGPGLTATRPDRCGRCCAPPPRSCPGRSCPPASPLRTKGPEPPGSSEVSASTEHPAQLSNSSLACLPQGVPGRRMTAAGSVWASCTSGSAGSTGLTRQCTSIG